MAADGKIAARLGAVRRIVVHAGLAHLDDIMSCALAYAFGVPHDAAIERRNPTPAELDDATTLVMDVGGVHDPERMDFDHHQRARTEEPKCTFKLLGEWLGADGELKALFPWYAAWNLMDVLGPHATAAAMGTTSAALEGFIANPLADWVVRRFADDPDMRRKLVRTLGNGIALTRRCWTGIREKTVVRQVGGFKVADMTACLAEEVSRCSEAWVRQHRPACILTGDSRGSGRSLLRCNDDPRLDFARCAGKPYALFAHPGGFILKTTTPEIDLAGILADARVARDGDHG
ncbi:MAG: MYG1 family protein [Kiritimatiellia bacterium]